MRIQIGVSHGLADHLKVDDCQVQIVNTVDEIFTLEYQEIDFLTFFKLIFHRLETPTLAIKIAAMIMIKSNKAHPRPDSIPSKWQLDKNNFFTFISVVSILL